MSDQPTSSSKSGDIKLPGVGPVPRKWFMIVGAGSVITIAYVMYKKKSAPAVAAAATTDAGTAAFAGQPCTDMNGNPGVYDSSGICQVDTNALGGYYAGSGAGGVSGVTPPVPGTGGFVTNGQWTQQGELDMENTGVDPAALAAALGAYLTGQPLTGAQQSMVDQAIAFEGYPPVAGPSGYPPAMHIVATGPSGPGTCPTGYTFSAVQTSSTGEVGANGGTGWCELNPATVTPSDPGLITVPNVVGRTVTDATAANTAAGLSTTVAYAVTPSGDTQFNAIPTGTSYSPSASVIAQLWPSGQLSFQPGGTAKNQTIGISPPATYNNGLPQATTGAASGTASSAGSGQYYYSIDPLTKTGFVGTLATLAQYSSGSPVGPYSTAAAASAAASAAGAR